MHDLFLHSDCDGELSPSVCESLADTLEGCMPQFEKYEKANESGAGHIVNMGVMLLPQ